MPDFAYILNLDGSEKKIADEIILFLKNMLEKVKKKDEITKEYLKLWKLL